MTESKTSSGKTRVKAGWQDKIFDAMARCNEVGREPIILIIHPNVFIELYREVFPLGEYYSLWKASDGEVAAYFNMDIIINSRIKDFQILNDCSWTDQVWDAKNLG